MSEVVGRAEETNLLRRFLRDAGISGGTLLLSGEPGVGKTELLAYAARAADEAGTMVLRVGGAEFEASVSFAGLNQALLPLLDETDRLASAHRQALLVALGVGSGSPPDRLTVCNAALALLRRAGAGRPTLLIVDDLHWLDRASAEVLGFVARRLTGSRTGLLAATRTGAETYFERTGLPAYEIRPLAHAAAAELLAARFPALDPRVAGRVLAAAQGNPLALLELPQALTASQRQARQSLPRVLPLSERLQTLFVGRVAQLPPGTRALLLAAALDGGASDLSVLQTAGRGKFSLDDLGPAERDGLVRVDEITRRVVFRHPLIQAAVVAAATTAQRREAHRALAGALAHDPDRQAGHLGEATVEPDAAIAATLERAARRVLRRGDPVGAVALFARAADLSPVPVERGRRLAEAAYIGAEAIGEMRHTSHLLEGTRQASPQLGETLNYASAAAFVMLNGDGHIDTIHRLLVAALENESRPDSADPAYVNALWTLALVCFFGGRAELWQPFYAALARLRPNEPELLTLTIDLFADPARTGVAALPRLETALATVHTESDLGVVQNIAGAAMYADRLAEVREPLWRCVERGRGENLGRRHLVALMDLAVDDFHRGNWAEAADLAAEGLTTSQERGGRAFAWYFWYHQALLAAVHGRLDISQELAERILGWAGPRGVRTAQAFAHHALTVACHGRSDFDTAYRHAAAISPPGLLASHVPHALWAVMDLVDAAVRTGRRAEAERHVAAIVDADIAALSPRLAILATACAALIADEQDAPGLFERALSLPTADQWPFDVARIRLAYGEHLRRSRHTVKSRTPLEAALATFRNLGADPWSARAESELRAAGLTRASASRPSAALTLTQQELQIARLAAAGLSNKQIAERLYLSPRTVSGHLYRIFPKLGVTKRSALRDALGPADDPA